MKRFVLTLFAVVVTAVVSFSAGEARADGFDAAYYAQRYPDVVAVLGTDPAALYNHYLTYGINEHRFQNAAEEASGQPAQPAAPAPAPEPARPVIPPDTYVDVDIENQTMTYYENGNVKLQSPCVTGDIGKGRGTPRGTFAITVCAKSKYLIGPTWKVWVDRWMRFTSGGCGLHDASWRSSFGGDIYKTNGSHGCVNLPHDTAIALYDMVCVGTPVVVH